MQISSTSKASKISIVMLNYNGASFLKETIPPLFELDYPDYEIIVIDNGSSDGSLEYLKKFERVVLVENEKNEGYSKGKNVGVSHATGEYVLFLDNDIKLRSKNILHNLIKAYPSDAGLIQLLLLDKGETMTYHYGLYFGAYGPSHTRPKLPLKDMLDTPIALVPIPAATGGALFFKKAVWMDLGGLDESQLFNIDDIDIGPRSWIFGYKNYLFTKDYADHLGINKTVTAQSYCERYQTMFSGHARAMLKNYRYVNLVCSFPLLFIVHLLKSIKFSFQKKSIRVLFAFIISIKVFFKNLPSTLEARKSVQLRRKIKQDVFLSMKRFI